MNKVYTSGDKIIQMPFQKSFDAGVRKGKKDGVLAQKQDELKFLKNATFKDWASERNDLVNLKDLEIVAERIKSLEGKGEKLK